MKDGDRMTTQEAIDWLLQVKDRADQRIEDDQIEYGARHIPSTKDSCAIYLAICAMRKTIPMKPINRKVWEHVDKTFNTCPHCPEILDDQAKHCRWCGQAIKWEGEETE